MKINKTKIKTAIEATEGWIKLAEERGAKDTFENKGGSFGFTILWCEKRNLQEYKEMLNYNDTKELDESLLELYKAI